MQRLRYLVLFLLVIIGCEDVIDIDLPASESRLIIDALIRIDINNPIIPFKVKVTTTTNFFEETTPASLESIVIITEINNEDGFVNTLSSTLIELEPGSGIYYPDPCAGCTNNVGISALNEYNVFYLYIKHKGKRYYAETKYVPVVPIEKIEVGNNTLFSGDEKEVIVTFTDDPEKDNFYLFDFDFGEYLVTDDQFYQGQQFEFSYFYDRTFESGSQIDVSILGSDETFYNYMDQLIVQSDVPQGPFQTPIATVRGNIFDITSLDNIEIFDNVERPNNFPLGYFAIVQEHKSVLTIE